MVVRESASCFAFAQLAAPSPSTAWIARPHLLNRLIAAPVAVLCAPAGYGKTTLAAQLAARHPNCCWVGFRSVQQDGQPPDGRQQLAALLRAWLEQDDPFESGLLDDPMRAMQHVLVCLSAEPTPRLLVIDGADAIRDPALLRALHRLAQHLPPALQLLITLRQDDLWSWHALYVSRSACRLNARDLEWRHDELEVLLMARAQFMGAVSRAWLGQWPAAIGLWLQSGPAWDEDPASSFRLALLDYCLQERIVPLPASAQRVLLHFSMCDRFPLHRVHEQFAHDAIEGVSVLLDAALVELDGSAGAAWLCIPPLVRDAAERWLSRFDPVSLRLAHVTAAEQALSCGRSVEALISAVCGRCIPLIHEVLRRAGWDLLFAGHGRITEQGLALLEPMLAQLDASMLLLVLQQRLQPGDTHWRNASVPEWTMLVQRVQQSFWQRACTAEQLDEFEAGILCMRLQHALAIDDHRLAFEHMARWKPQAVPSFLRTVATGVQAQLRLLEGVPDEAARLWEEALRHARSHAYRQQVLWFSFYLAEVDLARGDLPRALTLRSEALVQVRHHHMQKDLASCSLLCSHILHCLNQELLDEAEAALNALAEWSGTVGDFGLAHDILSLELYCRRADESAWRSSMRRLLTLDPLHLRPSLRVQLDDHLLQWWTMHEEKQRIQLWLSLLPPLAQALSPCLQTDGRNRLRAMFILGMDGAFEQLVATLWAHSSHLPLQRALLLAQLWEYERCHLVAREDWHTALLQMGQAAAVKRLQRLYPERWQALLAAPAHCALEHLDIRDRQLLQCLEQKLSNEWIAERLHLAQGTVKNRLSMLYRRIGVRSRSQALRWWLEHQ